MIVLKAIGNFFAKIGRWIRDTAWVQPLLIVGGIFGIIFSIPHITNWVGSWFNHDTNEADNYFFKYDLSLKGCEDKNSEADKLFEYIIDITNGTSTEEQERKFGEKFFVSFVQEGCPNCPELYDGLSTLQKNWTNTNEGYKIDDGKSFKLHTIFIDQYDEKDEDLNLFEEYFLTKNYPEVFEHAIEIAQGSDYCSNLGGEGSSYYTTAGNMIDPDSFSTPTTFLIDNEDPLAIVEVLFNFDPKEGEIGTAGRALTLMDCWNRKGVFTVDKND